jgi:hypothetical protein
LFNQAPFGAVNYHSFFRVDASADVLVKELASYFLAPNA